MSDKGIKADRSIQKRRIKIAFIIIGAVLALLFAVYLILSNVVSQDEPTQAQETYKYSFYVPNENEDFLNDPEYLSKDRTLHYTDSMGQGWIIDGETSCEELGAAFFQLYFHAIENGDHQSLNGLYKEKLATFTEFTPQRVYQKEVVFLSEERIDDNTFSITYSVDYNIMKNDGSFRRDIGSDMSRTRYMTLYYNTEGDSWIEDEITTG